MNGFREKLLTNRRTNEPTNSCDLQNQPPKSGIFQPSFCFLNFVARILPGGYLKIWGQLKIKWGDLVIWGYLYFLDIWEYLISYNISFNAKKVKVRRGIYK